MSVCVVRCVKERDDGLRVRRRVKGGVDCAYAYEDGRG